MSEKIRSDKRLSRFLHVVLRFMGTPPHKPIGTQRKIPLIKGHRGHLVSDRTCAALRNHKSLRDGKRLLSLLPLDRLPLEEAVDRDDTASPAIGIPEGRQIAHGLALSVDRLAPAFQVPAPIGNNTNSG